MKALVIYPHGIGDCILLTPALRSFHELTGEKCSVATLERFKSAQYFDHCPYIEQVYYTKDAWHDFENVHIGFQTLYDNWKVFAKDNGYKGVVMPMHNSPESKILINARTLGIKNFDSPQTDIFTTPEDREIADKLITDIVGSEEFGFVQTAAGHDVKDLPADFGRDWLLKNRNLKNVIEIGREIDPYAHNINVQFEILRRASAVCLPDSVFYHACHAMNKPVDFVYFARGASVYDRVRPLHAVSENVVFDLEGIK